MLVVWDSVGLISLHLSLFHLFRWPLFPSKLCNPFYFRWWISQGIYTVFSLLRRQGVWTLQQHKASHTIPSTYPRTFQNIQPLNFIEYLPKNRDSHPTLTAFESLCQSYPPLKCIVSQLYASISSTLSCWTLMYCACWLLELNKSHSPDD